MVANGLMKRRIMESKAIEFRDGMRSRVLPGCFNLEMFSFLFETETGFLSTVDDEGAFADFVRINWGFPCEGCYTDAYSSGFLGSYALALWFIEFDENNWFSFDDVLKETAKYLNSYSFVSDRTELRLVKGSFPPMMLDLPVVVDYREKSVTLWTGELQN
jgi:hypothetical protein